MKLKRIILGASLLAGLGNVLADAGGSFVIRDKPFVLNSAYAYTCPDPFDPSKQSTVIAFSGRQIDEQAIKSSDDPASALSAVLDSYFPDQEERPIKLELILARADAESPIQQISYTIPNESSGASVGAARYFLELKRNDGQRIEGTLRSKQASDKNSPFGGYFDVHFALDVHPPTGC